MRGSEREGGGGAGEGGRERKEEREGGVGVGGAENPPPSATRDPSVNVKRAEL